MSFTMASHPVRALLRLIADGRHITTETVGVELRMPVYEAWGVVDFLIKRGEIRVTSGVLSLIPVKPAPTKKSLCAQVLQLIPEGGITCAEIAEILDMARSDVSPALSWLRERGAVEGERAIGTKNPRAFVWRKRTCDETEKLRTSLMGTD